MAGNLDDADAVADELATDYAKTSYAAQAKLAMARLYMDKNRDQDAADALSQVIASDADEEVKHVRSCPPRTHTALPGQSTGSC